MSPLQQVIHDNQMLLVSLFFFVILASIAHIFWHECSQLTGLALFGCRLFWAVMFLWVWGVKLDGFCQRH
jgi:hypothetical protein